MSEERLQHMEYMHLRHRQEIKDSLDLIRQYLPKHRILGSNSGALEMIAAAQRDILTRLELQHLALKREIEKKDRRAEVSSDPLDCLLDV